MAEYKIGSLVRVNHGAYYVHTIGQNLDEFKELDDWINRPTYLNERRNAIGLVLSERRSNLGRSDYALVLLDDRILELDCHCIRRLDEAEI